MVLEELSEVEEIHVECLNGTLRHSSADFVGPLAEYCLERMAFDTVFLGTDGVSPTAICEADLVQARFKEMMCSRAGGVIVLDDSSKLHHAPFHAWAKLPEYLTLTTESQLESFREAGITIVTAA